METKMPAVLRSPSMSTTKEESRETSATTPDSTIPTKEPTGHITGFKLLITMISITLIGFLMLLDVSVVSTAIPKITTDFHSLQDVGWYGSAYLLANCALQPLSGKIYSEFNLKWSLVCFFGLFELGSAVCGAATSSTMLIIGRAIAGIGGAGIINGGYGIVHSIAPLERQPFLIGILIGIAQTGVLLGPLIGGALTEYVSWRWCFYINLPTGGLAILLFILVVNLPPTKEVNTPRMSVVNRIRKLDPIGFLLFAPAAVQLILALEMGGNQHRWGSATIIGLFCGAFGTSLAFIAWEYHMGDGAMIPLSIIRRRVIWSSCINYAFFVGSMMSATYYLPIYFQSVRNASPLISGVDLLPMIIATSLATIVTGILISRTGYYLPFAILSGVITVIGTGLTSTFTPTTTVGTWIGYQILMGIGRGLGFQIPIIAAQNNTEKKDVSIVNAMVVFSQNLGGAIFLSLDQVLFSSSLKNLLPKYASSINPQTVIAAGAAGIRQVVPVASLPGVLLAYSKSFDRVMYFAAGLSGAALIAATGMRWMNIKKKAEDEKKAEAENAASSVTDQELV